MTATDHATAKDTVADRPQERKLLLNPAIATRMLERNTHNRKLDPITVEKYRRDMAAGRWVYAADPIRFDVSGALLDGQHRLAALAECDPDVNLPMLIVAGLPPETQQVMDSGKARLAGQQLQMLGHKNGNILAAAVKRIIIYDESLLFRDNRNTRLITHSHIQRWIADNPGIVSHVQELISTLRNLDIAPRIATAAAICFLRIDVADTYEFFELLHDGAGTKGHPIVTLDKKLQRIRRQGQQLSDRDGLALFFLAWNAWREGRELTKFQRPRGGKWTVGTFPEPA